MGEAPDVSLAAAFCRLRCAHSGGERIGKHSEIRPLVTLLEALDKTSNQIKSMSGF